MALLIGHFGSRRQTEATTEPGQPLAASGCARHMQSPPKLWRWWKTYLLPLITQGAFPYAGVALVWLLGTDAWSYDTRCPPVVRVQQNVSQVVSSPQDTRYP